MYNMTFRYSRYRFTAVLSVGRRMAEQWTAVLRVAGSIFESGCLCM